MVYSAAFGHLDVPKPSERPKCVNLFVHESSHASERQSCFAANSPTKNRLFWGSPVRKALPTFPSDALIVTLSSRKGRKILLLLRSFWGAGGAQIATYAELACRAALGSRHRNLRRRRNGKSPESSCIFRLISIPTFWSAFPLPLRKGAGVVLHRRRK